MVHLHSWRVPGYRAAVQTLSKVVRPGDSSSLNCLSGLSCQSSMN